MMKNKLFVLLPVIAILIIGLVGWNIKSSAQTYPTFGVVSGVFTTQMDVGSTGSEVTKLQTFLAGNKAIYPEGLITGYYGPLTEAAVMRFQGTYGISRVGRVGPQTLAQLNSLLSNTGGFGDNNAPIISGVVLNRNANSVSIQWNTNENTRDKIYYDSKPLTFFETSAPKTEPVILGQFVSDTTLSSSNFHSINIPSLIPGATYYYMIQSVDAAGNVSVTWPASFVAL